MGQQQHIAGLGLPREPLLLRLLLNHLLPQRHRPHHRGGTFVAQRQQLCVHLV